jgi:hypothetical protein
MIYNCTTHRVFDIIGLIATAFVWNDESVAQARELIAAQTGMTAQEQLAALQIITILSKIED